MSLQKSKFRSRLKVVNDIERRLPDRPVGKAHQSWPLKDGKVAIALIHPIGLQTMRLSCSHFYSLVVDT